MSAELLFKRRIEVSPDRAFAERVIRRVPEPVRASAHVFKYRLALVVDGICVVRYDNEAGQGRPQASRRSGGAPYLHEP